MTSTKKVVALMSDLMFSVKIQDAAKRAGLETVFVSSQKEALARAKENPALLILDLNYAAADPLATIALLKGDPETSSVSLLGYVSHVQVDLKQDAQNQGCDTVVARSAFVQNLAAIFQRISANA